MNKLTSMTDAIAQYVPDGSSIAMGLALEPLIPFAAAHEIIRQQRRNLTLIGPISDILFDQLIGAGCVEKIVAAWVGNVSEGLAHCYRRATEQFIPRPIVTEDHSNFTIGLALLAAGLGSPYRMTRPYYLYRPSNPMLPSFTCSAAMKRAMLICGATWG